MPTVSFFLLLLSYCYPDWINGTITYFPNTCILTCPLLLSFLLLFSYLPTVSFFSWHFIHTATLIDWIKWTVTFFSCFFFSTCPLLLSPLLLFSHLSTVTFFPVTFFPVTFFPTWNCYFLSCHLFPVTFFPCTTLQCHSDLMEWYWIGIRVRRKYMQNSTPKTLRSGIGVVVTEWQWSVHPGVALECTLGVTLEWHWRASQICQLTLQCHSGVAMEW